MQRYQRSMVRFLLLVVCVCAHFLAGAQFYQPFYPGKNMTFTLRDLTEKDSAYQFIQVTDTLHRPEGVWYYFQRSVDTTMGYCETIPSVVGDSALFTNDAEGTWIFINQVGDSLYLRTVLSDNEEWLFYTFDNGNQIKAKVVLYDEFGIMPGVVDSIYRIRLRVYDPLGWELSDIYPDETKFDLSKQFGITEIYDFYSFPNALPQLYLRGNSMMPDTAISDVTAKTAHAFQPGYEMHYEQYFTNNEYQTHRLFKYFIQEAVAGDASMQITVQRTLWQETEAFGIGLDTILILDTIDLLYPYHDYRIADSLELRLIEDDATSTYGFADFIKDTAHFNGISHKWLYLNFYPGTDTENCLLETVDPTRISTYLYGYGLGVMQIRDSVETEIRPTLPDVALGRLELDMIYFQQGLVTWGNPIQFEDYGFTGLEHVTAKQRFTIYPNPADSYIQVLGMLEQDGYVCTDILGHIVQQGWYQNGISVQSLPSGLYMLQVYRDGQLLGYERLVRL